MNDFLRKDKHLSPIHFLAEENRRKQLYSSGKGKINTTLFLQSYKQSVQEQGYFEAMRVYVLMAIGLVAREFFL
jgi:hypothetical protein